MSCHPTPRPKDLEAIDLRKQTTFDKLASADDSKPSFAKFIGHFGQEHSLVETTLRVLRQEILAVPQRVREKAGDLGPLTEIDEQIDQTLYQAIHRAFPADGWLSEESPHESGSGRYWIIDPVDGTKELVSNIPEWAVSVGLWQDGKPQAGWIYHPPTDTFWAGAPMLGIYENQHLLTAQHVLKAEDLRVGISRSDQKKGLIPQGVIPEPQYIGSIAYKLALVAAGQLDATVSVTPKNIWDVAGGFALVQAAGGIIADLSTGNMIEQLDIMQPLTTGFIACQKPWVEYLQQQYKR